MTETSSPHRHDYLGHDHDENARRTRLVVTLTAVMMVGEIAAGLLFNSLALLADGVHMATHAGALGVAALAYAYARRHADDPAFTFGTGKVGDLAGFASALILGVVAVAILIESVSRLFDPRPVAFAEATVVAIVGLGVNLASALLLGHGHSHGHEAHGSASEHAHGHAHPQDHGREPSRLAGDNNLRSAYFHVLADALTSVLAILALIGGSVLGWAWLDPAMGVVGAAVIGVWSLGLMRDTGAVLVDRADPRLLAAARAAVEAPGDARVTDLHLWQVGPGAYAAIVAVIGPDAATVRSRLASVTAIAHVSVEAQPPAIGERPRRATG